MASAENPGYASDRPLTRERKANPVGAYVATAGVVIFTIAVFLDWFSSDALDENISGYDADGANPLTAYLGIGLVIALFYAMTRARGGQHRGLTLVTMAAGIAATLLALSNLFDATGVASGDVDVEVEIGVWIALLGGIVWSVGAGLLAKEPEGDDDWHGARTALGHERHEGHTH
ncbi:hypothetical protein [Blastococcus sp. URHD0036]|uniref:hypothetical protein n=1 Tax=Blastococcus sp. URHD0036 TaxID=1380356 RepID=UPI00049696DC|nr:hypothetical protein [Blastococcus sp. URHD0036]